MKRNKLADSFYSLSFSIKLNHCESDQGKDFGTVWLMVNIGILKQFEILGLGGLKQFG